MMFLFIVMQHGKVVDRGTRDEVMDHPTSEYTRNLLQSVPELEGGRKRHAILPFVRGLGVTPSRTVLTPLDVHGSPSFIV